MIKSYLRLVAANISKRRLRSWLTVLGVVIGIAAVVALIGIGEGLRTFVTGQFNLVGADVLQVQAEGTGMGPPGEGVVDPLTESQLRAVRQIKGVKTAVGRVIEFGKAEYNDRVYFGMFASMPDGPARRDLEDLLNYETAQGRLLKDGDTLRAVVGHDYADEDRFGKPVEVGSRLTVNSQDLTVVGILKKKGSFIIDNTVLLNEEALRDSFGVPSDVYDGFAAQPEDGVNPNGLKLAIEKVLRRERHVDQGEEDFTVQTSASALRQLDSTLFAVQLFVYILAGISILVGGIGITNTMYTSVLERIADIGTMKAVGAQNRDIFWIFFLESGLIGMVGGAIGILLGAGFAQGLALLARNLFGQADIVASISAPLVLGTLAFSFVVGTLSGLLPAAQAAHLEPVEALAYAK